MKRNIKNILKSSLCILVGATFTSCGYLDTRPTSDYYAEEVFDDITRAQNVLYYAYNGLSTFPEYTYDFYTDNAIHCTTTYDQLNSGWTSEYSPNSGIWSSAYGKINHINLYMRDCFNLSYNLVDEENGYQTKKRMRGEAFGMRAYYKWLLLKNYAGPSNDGEFLSFPILKKNPSDSYETTFDSLDTRNIARATYAEGFKSIMDDIDSAYVNIEWMNYHDGSNDWNNKYNVGRVCREMLLAMKARMYLFAASDAYQQVTWEEAAQVIYDAIVEIDGVETLKDLSSYDRQYDNTTDRDHFWRSNYSTNGTYEGYFYPMTMWGYGYVNPTEDLVRSFPDTVGFPINESAIYDPANPYANRDFRFKSYIFYNGYNEFRGATVETYEGGGDRNGGVKNAGTRTGYFCKRFLSDVVDKTPRTTSSTSDIKFNVMFSRQMLYLDFAEACVNAYGLGTGPGMAFNAVDALEKVRTRVGLNSTQDQYLRPVAASDLTKLKALVYNERRLNTCFNGERMYDRMRWMLPAEQMEVGDGIVITKVGDNSYTYSEPVTVAEKHFDERMYYFPIPRTEVLKSNAIIQNKGWE